MVFAKESGASPTTPTRVPDGLKRDALRARDITFLLVSAAAPLTIVVGVAPLALAVGGPGAPIIYMLAALVLGLFAVGFMALTRRVSSFSGFYGYIAQTVGRRAGLGAGLTAWVSYNGLQIGLYGLLGIQARVAGQSLFGIDLPWWLYALVSVLAVWYLGWRGVDIGARVVAVLLVLETIIVVVIAGAVLFQGGASGLDLAAFRSEHLFTPGIAAVLVLGFGAFMGFEQGALYREEARDPDRTVPRATYVSVAFIGAFYAVSVWMVVQAFGTEQVQAVATDNLNTGATVYIVAAEFVGPWCEHVMSVLVVTSIFAGQLAFHNTINRYSLALSREGVFPTWAGRIDPRHCTPSVSGALQSALAAGLVIVFAALALDPFTQFLVWLNTPGVLGVLILQALTGIGALRYFLTHRDQELRWYVVPATLVATVSLLAVVWLFVENIDLLTGLPGGSAVNVVLILISPAALLVGIVWAAVMRRRNPTAYQRIGTGA